MTSLARYVQYLFNLQFNTARTSMEQRMRLTAYEEHATAIACVLERLRHENAVLRMGALPPSKQDRELQVAYRRRSEAERGWNYIHMLLDITREEVDIHIHGIIDLEHAYETQGIELEERTETIANLEQQLLELQGQAPPKTIDHQEIDAMSGIDED
jgi:hypothetical protein